MSESSQAQMLSIDPDAKVSVVTDVLNEVRPGALFFCIRGSKFDGNQFANQAIEKGAIAVITDQKIYAHAKQTILVKDARRSLGLCAAHFWGNPSKRLLCVGVTGTNGKTTSTYILEHLLNRLGVKCGLVGTVEQRLGSLHWPSTQTHPSANDLQKKMSEFENLGAKACVTEVSSHALVQSRPRGVHFDGAIFTNLTRDHLDYHGTMDSYFQAKESLFLDYLNQSEKARKVAVIHTDNEFGRKIKVSSNVQLITFGQSGEQDYNYQIKRTSIAGSHFHLEYTGDFASSEFSSPGHWDISVPLVGKFNVANVVGALVCLHQLGFSMETMREALMEFKGVPGRLQSIPNFKDIHVFVDYAHTPDALEQVCSILKSLMPSPSARLILVFGCGGDRDQGKRALMGAAAAKFSDLCIVTSDNPRFESPQKIIDDILVGFRTLPIVIVDRKAAIEKAMSMAKAGDVVLIAGKGHESFQEVSGEKFKFSDIEVAGEFL
jgi:UDP-N-acetylmuramoyl-L-alanyl-D-glutamate--2,6-diaminopimelate ligase